MNAFLDDLRNASPLQLAMETGSVAPDVRFGCERDLFGDCAGEEEGEPIGKRWMTLSVGRPSAEWTRSVAAALEDAERSHLLVVTLEIGDYWPRQKNLRGDKEVRLGTGSTQRLPWLTSLDRPVQVIQLTGALIGREGEAVRIGAEGLLARHTSIVVSGFGAQELITDQDIEKLATLRRHDLTGKPLAWQVALENLVRQLTGQGLIR